MERVMAEMESEMSSMSEDNPDPRQLGRLDAQNDRSDRAKDA